MGSGPFRRTGACDQELKDGGRVAARLGPAAVSRIRRLRSPIVDAIDAGAERAGTSERPLAAPNAGEVDKSVKLPRPRSSSSRWAADPCVARRTTVSAAPIGSRGGSADPIGPLQEQNRLHRQGRRAADARDRRQACACPRRSEARQRHCRSETSAAASGHSFRPEANGSATQPAAVVSRAGRRR